MKIECKCCHSKIEINEKEYTPGDVVSVECRRCGEEIEVVIPEVENDEDNKRPVATIVKNASPENHTEIPAEDRATHSTKNEVVTVSTNRENVNVEASIEQKMTSQKPRKLEKDKDASSAEKSVAKPPVNKKPKEPGTQPTAAKHQVPKPPVEVPVIKSKGLSNGTILMIVIGLFALVGIISWISKNSGSRDALAVDSDSVVEVEYVEEIVEEAVEDSLWSDTVAAAAAEVAEAPAADDITRVYLPNISHHTSSEAYDMYPAYVTDEKFGDSWATTSIVQDAARNGYVEYFVKGTGDIEGYPLSIDAVRLKDGRIYGRYHNDYNGVKLDINGAFDANEDLVIKLGHKSETSYWILKYEGRNDDGSLEYRGTWGGKNKETSLRLIIRE